MLKKIIALSVATKISLIGIITNLWISLGFRDLNLRINTFRFILGASRLIKRLMDTRRKTQNF